MANREIVRSSLDLISYAAKHIVQGYVSRALTEEPVTNLGAFSRTSPEDPRSGGWILRVVTKHKRECFVVIKPNYNPTGSVYHVDLIDAPLWQYWIGDKCADNKLYMGNMPEEAREEREKCLGQN